MNTEGPGRVGHRHESERTRLQRLERREVAPRLSHAEERVVGRRSQSRHLQEVRDVRRGDDHRRALANPTVRRRQLVLVDRAHAAEDRRRRGDGEVEVDRGVGRIAGERRQRNLQHGVVRRGEVGARTRDRVALGEVARTLRVAVRAVGVVRVQSRKRQCLRNAQLQRRFHARTLEHGGGRRQIVRVNHRTPRRGVVRGEQRQRGGQLLKTQQLHVEHVAVERRCEHGDRGGDRVGHYLAVHVASQTERLVGRVLSQTVHRHFPDGIHKYRLSTRKGRHGRCSRRRVHNDALDRGRHRRGDDEVNRIVGQREGVDSESGRHTQRGHVEGQELHRSRGRETLEGLRPAGHAVLRLLGQSIHENLRLLVAHSRHARRQLDVRDRGSRSVWTRRQTPEISRTVREEGQKHADIGGDSVHVHDRRSTCWRVDGVQRRG